MWGLRLQACFTSSTTLWKSVSASVRLWFRHSSRFVRRSPSKSSRASEAFSGETLLRPHCNSLTAACGAAEEK
jgi:hypothetical protein